MTLKHEEDKTDVLFFLLRLHLEDSGEAQHATQIESIWQGGGG